LLVKSLIMQMALQYDTSFYGVDKTPFLIDGEVQIDTTLLW